MTGCVGTFVFRRRCAGSRPNPPAHPDNSNTDTKHALFGKQQLGEKRHCPPPPTSCGNPKARFQRDKRMSSRECRAIRRLPSASPVDTAAETVDGDTTRTGRQQQRAAGVAWHGTDSAQMDGPRPHSRGRRLRDGRIGEPLPRPCLSVQRHHDPRRAPCHRVDVVFVCVGDFCLQPRQ